MLPSLVKTLNVMEKILTIEAKKITSEGEKNGRA
jgi:hypothetical protein